MISVVTTVFNDRAGVAEFLKSMCQQTLKPDEVVVVDGGSRDGTWELLLHAEGRGCDSIRLKVLREQGCNVARGRNLAIEAAAGELIVSTDVGCEWDPEWLAELAAPLGTLDCEVVIGSWAVKRNGIVGQWAEAEWALKGDQRLEADGRSYSSSRSIAYRRVTWRALGKYPEDLTLAADDAVFHYLIELANVPRVGAPIVRCYWHRHQKLRSFLRESYRYGLGDGEALIRKRDHGLIAGRLIAEVFGLVVGGIGAVTLAGLPAAICIGFALVATFSISARAYRLRTARRLLASLRIRWPLLKLLVFIYGTKIYAACGYARGGVRGAMRCSECRHRLQVMTPQHYAKEREALAT